MAGQKALDPGDLGQATCRTHATARRLVGTSADRNLRVWVRARESRNGFSADRPMPGLLWPAAQRGDRECSPRSGR